MGEAATEVAGELNSTSRADAGEDEEVVDIDALPLERCQSDVSTVPGEMPAAIEAFWPDDCSWLPAQLLRHVDDEQVEVRWDEDGSESVMPLENTRPCGDSILDSAAAADDSVLDSAAATEDVASQRRWQLIESRSSPGFFYYFD